MKNLYAYRVVWVVLVAGLLSGVVFRESIRRTFSRRRTVADTIAELKLKRGAEFQKSYPDLAYVKRVLLVAVKNTRRLEVWTQNDESDLFQYRKTYAFTGFSGKAGPKRLSGDRQIPEGVYALTGLKPNSRHRLSVKVGYPNAVDEEFARKERRTNLGGDIFIHGSNTSIGCIPIGDPNAEELFFLLAHVKPGGAHIVIMPVDFRLKRFRNYTGAKAYERRIYRLVREEIRTKLPAINLSTAFFAKGEKKTAF